MCPKPDGLTDLSRQAIIILVASKKTNRLSILTLCIHKQRLEIFTRAAA
jgi:hypothetical protein